MKTSRTPTRGFTLVETLVVAAIVALLVSLSLPSLSAARDAARGVRCMSNQRQLLTAWTLYAHDFREHAMPLAYWSAADIGTGPQVFWWGTHGTTSTPPDHTRGFLAPYLSSALAQGSVYECPNQPWGTYRAQGPSRTITSTYGYNGYYLSPAKTPGWASSIGHRPWQRLSTIARPGTLAVFADTLLPPFSSAAGALPGNTALLDPPLLYATSGWTLNTSPTTAFRHARSSAGGTAIVAHADGHVRAHVSGPRWLTHRTPPIGSLHAEPGASGTPDSESPGDAGLHEGMTVHYVPDWRDW